MHHYEIQPDSKAMTVALRVMERVVIGAGVCIGIVAIVAVW